MLLRKKALIGLFALIFPLAQINNAKEYEFKDLVVFGDSFSDVGNIYYTLHDFQIINSKMVAGGEPNYTEYFALLLTGKNSLPFGEGGSNYALTDARTRALGAVSSREISAETMVVRYLKEHQLSDRNVYVLWVGANDLANTMGYLPTYFNNERFFNPLINFFAEMSSDEPQYQYDEPQYKERNISYATLAVAELAETLIDHGAKYVIVPNQFNLGLTSRVTNGVGSLFSMLLTAIFSNSMELIHATDKEKILLQYILFEPLLRVGQFFNQLGYDELAGQINIPATHEPGSGERFIRARQHTFNQRFGLLGGLVDAVSEFLTFSTLNFNYFLEQELSAIQGNHIVYMDIYRLFNEIIDDPKFYGFDDIIVPACNGFRNSNFVDCNRADAPGYHRDKNYLFSDSAHPSPLLHQIFAEYMISVFNAPVFISSLARQLMAAKQSNMDATFNAVVGINPENVTGEVLPLAEVAGTTWKVGEPYDNDARHSHFEGVNLGLLYGANPRLLTGVMVSLALGKAHPYENFTYHYDSELVNFFGKYNLKEHVWALGELTFGRLGARDIKRTITLGAGKRTESSRTNVGVVGLGLTLGYDWRQREDLIYTPYMRFNFSRYHLSDFKEENNLSTSMRYGKSNFNAADLTLALRRAQQFSSLKTYAELGITAPLQHTPMKILAGLKSTPISFKREIDIHRKPRLKLSLGFARYLKPNLSLTGNLNYQVDRRHNQELSYSLGLKTTF